MPGSDIEIEDGRLIRELLQNWAIWRDAGDWERFRTVWHPDGRMMATWTQGTGDEFIEISKQAWAKGVSILHFLGGISVARHPQAERQMGRDRFYPIGCRRQDHFRVAGRSLAARQ